MPVKTETKPHPRGEQGTKASVAEMLKKIRAGKKDPRVRAWAIETIKNAGTPRDKLTQAKALLDRLRKDRIYLEDPVDVEFIPSAACTLVGCDGLMFLGEDCDGLTVAFLSAAESIGIEGAVIEHSYSAHQVSEHVMAAVRAGDKWYRCDPSTKQPFGEVSEPTRERLVMITTGKLGCDNSKGFCDLGKVGSVMDDMRETAEFVGVGRPRQGGAGALGAPEAEKPPMTEELYEQGVRWFEQRGTELENAWLEAKAAYDDLRKYRYIQGLPLLDGNDKAAEGGWTQKQENIYAQMSQIVPVMLAYARKVVDRVPEFGLSFDPSNNNAMSIVVDGKKMEEYPQVVIEGGALVLKQGTEIKATVPASGQVGMPLWLVAVLVIAGAVVLITGIVATAITTYGTAIAIAGALRDWAQQRMMKDAQEYEERLIAGGMSPEEAHRKAMDYLKSAEAARTAEAERTKTDPVNELLGTLKIGLYVIGGVALIGGAIYAVNMIRGPSRGVKLLSA